MNKPQTVPPSDQVVSATADQQQRPHESITAATGAAEHIAEPAGEASKSSERQLRISYLTGSFPAATHTFFWREIQALRELGVQVDIVSTWAPQLKPTDDQWRHEALSQTEYLLPLQGRQTPRIVGSLLKAGPAGWMRTMSSWLRADGTIRKRLQLLAAVPLGAKLAALAQERQWDHVHVGFTEQTANIALYANRLTGLPYSVSQHHTIHKAGGNQREKWSQAAFGTVVSTYLLEEVLAWSDKKWPTPIIHVPHGLDVESFKRRSVYHPWNGEGDCRLFSCGRLMPTKGHSEAVRALAILKQSGLSCRLRIAGAARSPEDTYPNHLRDLAEELGVSDQLELLGNLTTEKILRELEQAHVMVLATHSEGWGSAIAEAVATGTPTVASSVGGVIDIITHGENGLLVPPHDPDSLAAAIERLLRDPELAATISEHGPETIRQRYGRLNGPSILLNAIRQACADEPIASTTVSGSRDR